MGCFGVGRPVNDLDRDTPAKTRVVGQEHGAHPASPEAALDAILAGEETS